MGFLSETLGEQRMENFKLAENNVIGNSLTVENKLKPHKPLYTFEELEYCYRSDALTFNAINKSVQMIMAGGFKNFLHDKKYVVTKFTKFFENIGDIGDDITFEELLENIFRDQMVYGNSFVEKIYDESDTKIVDLSPIDPKRIDYAKDSQDKIILDENGKPIGYVVKFDSGTFISGDEIPKKYKEMIKQESNTKFVLFKRICHFKLYTIGDKLYGIGLIESAYKSAIYKKNMEKAKANFVYLKGFPQMVAYVGSDRRMATPSDIKNVEKQINTADYQRNFTFPDWVKLDSPKFSESNLSEEALKDMRTDQMAALSAPQALVSGSGEATNRATLGDQRVLWEFTLKDIIKKTMAYFKKYILKPINESNNYGGVPDIEWSELRAENIEETMDKIIKILTSNNSLSLEMKDDLEEELRQLMSIKESKRENSKRIRKEMKEQNKKENTQDIDKKEIDKENTENEDI